MNVKTTLLILIAAALLVPGAAQADHGWSSDTDWNGKGRVEHRHSEWCRHDPEPRPRPGGRYELRTVSQWVDGYYTQTWVPERCSRERRGRRGRRVKTVCAPGHYESRWVDGHYVQQQQWVWVPYRYRDGYGYRYGS